MNNFDIVNLKTDKPFLSFVSYEAAKNHYLTLEFPEQFVIVASV